MSQVRVVANDPMIMLGRQICPTRQFCVNGANNCQMNPMFPVGDWKGTDIVTFTTQPDSGATFGTNVKAFFGSSTQDLKATSWGYDGTPWIVNVSPEKNRICFTRELSQSLLVENLARTCGAGKNEACVATQSTTYILSGVIGAASNAVDGITTTAWADGSCIHTALDESNPWWRVDFGRGVEVTGVRVYNRCDYGYRRKLNPFSVYVGNNATNVLGNCACATNQFASLPPDRCIPIIDVTCDAPVIGQYLYIRLEGTERTLHVCEVQVRGYDRNDFPISRNCWEKMSGTLVAPHFYTNLARTCGAGKNEACVATQSTAGVGAASNAVDGNIQTQFAGGSCMHAEAWTPNPWWRVDFGREVEVTGVRVYNRGDCCQERLQGFSVNVGNSATDVLGNAACAVNQDAPLSAPYIADVTCDAPVIGQYLYIRLEGTKRTLHVCEVQVQGYDNGQFPGWEKISGTLVAPVPYLYTFLFTLADMNGIWLTDWSEAMALPTMTSELRFIFNGE
jgi:hypothetical protein